MTPKVSSPGWYSVATTRRPFLARLGTAAFEIYTPPAATPPCRHYVRITRDNLALFRELAYHEQVFRVSAPTPNSPNPNPDPQPRHNRFDEEAACLASWLCRTHDSAKTLAFEARAITDNHYTAPTTDEAETVFPSLAHGAAICRTQPGPRCILWRVVPNPNPTRFLWVKLLGRERGTATRYCEQYRSGDPDLASFKRAAGLAPADTPTPTRPPDPWELYYHPDLAGRARPRLEALPLRHP